MSDTLLRGAGDWSELKQLELIRLDQNNLSGELPPSWGALTNLRTLTLWDNKLAGEIPDSWANMQASLTGPRLAHPTGSEPIQQLLGRALGGGTRGTGKLQLRLACCCCCMRGRHACAAGKSHAE